MRTSFFPLLLFLLTTFSLSAQEKGVTPLQNPESLPARQESAWQAGINQNPETYAVVVGISDYQDEGIPDLRFADKDALAFAGFLQSPAGGSLDEDHLKVLINEQATAAQFAIALDWLWEVVQENDQVIIYFSGHGDVERKSITQPGYLLCWDAPARVYMAGGAFNVRDLNDVVSTLSIQNKARVALITDACRAGKLSGSGIDGAQATAANLAKQYANEIKILSCQPDEYSLEGEQWGGGRGAFSYHLVDGLYGLADRNGDGMVNLMELRGYLEERVSEEVAPESQLPMTVGNGRQELAQVYPELLEELQQGRRGQMRMFTGTESRGMEEEVLAAADSNVVKMYLAFQKSLADQNFFCDSTEWCADRYYEKLSREPQLERLHSSMRRNYAAALQDDAQQVMNIMLKSGLTKMVLKNANAVDIYQSYPAYLQRAAELLGEQHYMYPLLQARRLFFEGQIAGTNAEKRAFYRKALHWQPDMPHAMVQIIQNTPASQLDSAKYFFEKVTHSAPAWVEPYLEMSHFYRHRLAEPQKAEEMLNMAGQIDSASVLVWYKKAHFFLAMKNYEKAEKWFLKVVESDGLGICFPCAHNDLGYLYSNIDSPDEAEKQFRKAIQIDSLFFMAYINLGEIIYRKTGDLEEAERHLQKAMQLDSAVNEAYEQAASFYERVGHHNKALDLLIDVEKKNPNYFEGHPKRYRDFGKIIAKAENGEPYLEKMIFALEKSFQFHNNEIVTEALRGKLDSTHFKDIRKVELYWSDWLGMAYLKAGQIDKAGRLFKSLNRISPDWMGTYLGLAWCHHARGEDEKARLQIERGIQFEKNNGGQSLVNWLHRFCNDWTWYGDEIHLFQQLVAWAPEYEKASFHCALLQADNGDSEAAFSNLDLALDNGYDQFNRILKAKEFDSLRKESERWRTLLLKHFSKKMKSDDPADFLQAGKLFYLLGKPDTAETLFEKHVRTSEKTSRYNVVAIFYKNHGEFDLAESLFRLGIDNYPEALYLRRNLARLYFFFGKKEEAFNILEEAIDLKPDDSSTNAIYCLLSYYDDPGQAKNTFEASDRMPYWDAMELMRSNQFEKADAAWSKLSAISNDWWLDLVKYKYLQMKIRQGHTEQALALFEEILAKGSFVNYQLYQTDAALQPLRDEDQFKNLLRRYFPEKTTR